MARSTTSAACWIAILSRSTRCCRNRSMLSSMTTACGGWRGHGAAWPGWSAASKAVLASKSKSSTCPGPRSVATWSVRRTLTRAICSAKFMKKNSACRAASRMRLIVVDARHPPSARPDLRSTDDVNALAHLAGVAAAAFCPTFVGAHPALLEVDDFAHLATVTDIAGSAAATPIISAGAI